MKSLEFRNPEENQRMVSLISKAVRENGMEYTKTAKVTGLNVDTIRKWEKLGNSFKRVKPGTILLIAKYFHVSEENLIKWIRSGGDFNKIPEIQSIQILGNALKAKEAKAILIINGFRLI